jgi:two-component system sensor histidine kinase YesM
MKAVYRLLRSNVGWRNPRSLRKRLFIGLLICTVVPILLIGAASYYAIYTILDRKAVSSIESTLHQVRTNLEKAYDNLNYVAQQLTGKNLQMLYYSSDPVERYLLSQQVYEHLQLVSFTNPDTGLFYLFFPDTGEIFYQNQPARSDARLSDVPVLTSRKGVVYHAPHRTFAFGDGLVLAVSRPVNILLQTEMSVYVETADGLYDRLLNERQYGMPVTQVLADEAGTIVFSQDERRFPPGTAVKFGEEYAVGRIVGPHYYFEEHSAEQGWTLYAIVNRAAMQQEIRGWMIAWIAIGAGSLLFSMAIGWSIWRMVYFPLRKLNREIRELGDSRFDDETQIRKPIRLTRIVEFDAPLQKFQDMRSNVWTLMQELRRNEEEKRYLEVEKLAAQINPHFLYNTLNTVQWLAKSKGEEEIVSLVTVFIRLLRYNLGKDGGLVPLSQEIEALRDYLKLQQIRYHYEFPVTIRVDPDTLAAPVPRFMLQPLLENALYHGHVGESSEIGLSVEAAEDGRFVRVEVKDNGPGMTPEQIEQLLKHDIPEKEKVGMGIGLRYVRTMLNVHFGGEGSLNVFSSPEKGTTIELRFPVLRLERKEELS